jgi:hypothetical protein
VTVICAFGWFLDYRKVDMHIWNNRILVFFFKLFSNLKSVEIIQQMRKKLHAVQTFPNWFVMLVHNWIPLHFPDRNVFRTWGKIQCFSLSQICGSFAVSSRFKFSDSPICSIYSSGNCYFVYLNFFHSFTAVVKRAVCRSNLQRFQGLCMTVPGNYIRINSTSATVRFFRNWPSVPQ